MNKQNIKQQKKERRKNRIRAKIKGSKNCLRLSVFRSNTGMYVQLINDDNGKTVVSVHNKEIKEKGNKIEISFKLGKLLAKKAVSKKIEKVVFDRGGCKYHGRVKAIADGARESGLKF